MTGTGSFTKLGGGTLTLSGNNPGYSGITNAAQGQLLVNSNFSGSDVSVWSGGLLGGVGTVGDIDAGVARVSPGTSPGRLSSAGNALLANATVFKVEINGTTAGTEYDQLAVAGAVTLDGASLEPSIALGFTPPLASTYVIVTAAGGVSGAFAGLPHLAFLSIGTRDFQIRYDATSVVLVRMDQPGPIGADLGVIKSDGIDSYVPGQVLQYTIVAYNGGWSVSSGWVQDNFPAALEGITWTCSASPGSFCNTASGVGNISAGVDLLVGGNATFVATATVAAGTTGSLTNTTFILPRPGVHDIYPGNDIDTDIDVPRGSFFTVTPCRLIDTRDPSGPFGGPALVAGASRTFPAAGSCGIPFEATAVLLNVTVVSPTSSGNLRIFPTGTPVQTVSALNYSAQQTRANNGIFALDPSGSFDILCTQWGGTTHVVVDVMGYFVE